MTGLYIQGKNNIGKGNIDLIGDQIDVLLIDTSLYTIDLDNDEFQSDIPEAAIIAEKTLTNKTWEGAIFDADDVTFLSLSSDQLVGAIVLVQYQPTLSTSALIYANDNAPSFPVTPDGTDFSIVWDNDINKIFKL